MVNGARIFREITCVTLTKQNPGGPLGRADGTKTAIIPCMKNPNDTPAANEERRPTFDRQQKVMGMFSDNAKTYIQISAAALALTLTFAHEILNIPKGKSIVDGWMIVMWVCFLLTIISGAFYQYLAAKYMEATIDWEHSSAWNWLEPGTIYGTMLAAFYLGSTIFTVYAIIRLSQPAQTGP